MCKIDKPHDGCTNTPRPEGWKCCDMPPEAECKTCGGTREITRYGRAYHCPDCSAAEAVKDALEWARKERTIGEAQAAKQERDRVLDLLVDFMNSQGGSAYANATEILLKIAELRKGNV